MNINQWNKNGGTDDIAPLAGGTYVAVCVGIIDIGTQVSEWNGERKERNQILIMFDFPYERIEINGEDLPRCMSIRVTKTLDSKGNFRKYCSSWRGRDFTADELLDFDLQKIIGAPAMITVTENVKDGKTMSYISGIGKLIKGQTPPTPTRKLYFNMQVPESYGVIEKIPNWMVETINKSLEVQATKHYFKKGQDKHHAPPPSQSSRQAPPQDCYDDGADDVPF
jgi:hypothetical protein